MLETAKGQGPCDVYYGHGIVKAKAAYEYLENNECVSDEAFHEPQGGCMEVPCTMDSDCDDGNPNTIDMADEASELQVRGVRGPSELTGVQLQGEHAIHRK